MKSRKRTPRLAAFLGYFLATGALFALPTHAFAVCARPCPSPSAVPTPPPQVSPFWQTDGNNNIRTGTNFLGTNGNQPLEVKVNRERVLRLEPAIANANLHVGPNLIGGDASNLVAAGVQGATVAGGGGLDLTFPRPNSVLADWGTVGGGDGNTAAKDGATVAGGGANTASGLNAAVGGGSGNVASGDRALIAGGQDNFVSGSFATVAGGVSNTASGNEATVAGGANNTAVGESSFAAGTYAYAAYAGSFVWADENIQHGPNFYSLAVNQFSARATGGFRFVTGFQGGPDGGVLEVGASLPSGSGPWTSLSDRKSKENFERVDTPELLKWLSKIPVLTWNYKTQARSIRHIGPTAQDFARAFKVGEDDRHITTIDAEGVALAAIQGLYKMLQEKDAEIRKLQARQAEFASYRDEIHALRARLDLVEQQTVLRKASAG